MTPSSATTFGLATSPFWTGTRGSFAEAKGSAFLMTFTWLLIRSKLSATLMRAVELLSAHMPFAPEVAEKVMRYW